jgi:hypothetical protein
LAGGNGGAGSDVSPTFGPGLPNSGVYAGGGGGQGGDNGTGGTGGGGDAGGPLPAANGTPNTGGGGGGRGFPGPAGTGGTGGSGIVIVKQNQASPTYSVASGVWSLQCQYNFKKQGTWTPSAQHLV